jgi:hypothetical protein
MVYDEDGLLIRWAFKYEHKGDSELVAIKKIEFFNERLHLKLAMRKRAIQKWNKLKVLVMLMRVFGDSKAKRRKKKKLPASS